MTGTTGKPRRSQADFEAGCRRRAHEYGDPAMLAGRDVIHYAECLIRFADHRVMSEDWGFWGEVADHFNRAMHLPDHSDYAASMRLVREFNAAVTMASRYLDISPASQETRMEILRKYFPPPPGTSTQEQET